VDCLSALKGEALAFGRRLPALRLRRSLIAIQIAVSAVLLVVAGLLGRSAGQAWRTSPGYSLTGLYVVQPDANWVPGETPRDADRIRQQVVDFLARTPGVSGIAHATLAPLWGTGRSYAAPAATGPNTPVHFNQVDRRYFETLGVPLVAGHGLGPTDGDAVIVNAALARRFWGDERAAVGRVLFIPPAGEGELVSGEPAPLRPMTVIGVTPTLQTTNVGVPDEPTYYTLLTPRDARTAFLVVRAGEGVPLPRLILDHLRSTDPDALATVSSIHDRLRERTAPARVGGVVAGLIGLLALAVAAVGIHGVIVYTIACRTRDIGLYQALGAQPAHVLRVVFAWTLRGVAMGALAGLLLLATVAAAFFGPFREALNGANPLDPIAFAVGIGVLTLVVLIAVGVPARRAMSLSPIDALRRE
jgi:hypothetical protein